MEVKEIAQKVLSGISVFEEELEYLFLTDDDIYDELLYWANKIRKKFKGSKIKLCSIINAKSGLCSEDCSFCAQSSQSKAKINVYPLVGEDKIIESFKNSKLLKASCFSIVTSGRKVSKKELKIIGETIKKLCLQGEKNISASLGELSEDDLLYLKDCGLKRYHHNLETSERFFPYVCTAHSYSDRLKTLRLVKEAGLKLCSGGIFGLGENWKDRYDLAMTLKRLNVDSVPLNFLNPIKGTPLENAKRLSPREILKIIALFRFVLPEKDIRVCGGREVNLRDLQSWIFYAGANGMMTGGYLTTCGRNPELDRQMIDDLELELEYAQ